MDTSSSSSCGDYTDSEEYEEYLRYLEIANEEEKKTKRGGSDSEEAADDAEEEAPDAYPDDSEEEYEPHPEEVEHIILRDENRITTDILSEAEMTAIVAARTNSIEKNDDCLVPVGNLSDPISLAKKELMYRKCPLCISRKVGKRINPVTKKEEIVYEIINPNDPRIIFATHYPEVL